MLIKYDYEWLVMMFIFIVFCLYLNWLYTLLVLGILTLILGNLMFDKSFNVIEKEIKELENDTRNKRVVGRVKSKEFCK